MKEAEGQRQGEHSSCLSCREEVCAQEDGLGISIAADKQIHVPWYLRWGRRNLRREVHGERRLGPPRPLAHGGGAGQGPHRVCVCRTQLAARVGQTSILTSEGPAVWLWVSLLEYVSGLLAPATWDS